MRLALTILVILCVQATIAQTQTEGQSEQINEHQVETKSTTNQPQSESTISKQEKDEILRQIAQIENHINSIDIKAEYILNNPEEKKIAEEQGWFSDMKATKEALEEKKEHLLKLIAD